MTRLDDSLEEAASGAVPDTIALMRVLMEANDEDQARSSLAERLALARRNADTEATRRLQRLSDLWAAHPQAWTVVRGSLDVLAHDRTDSSPDEMLRYWASAFDRLAGNSPEASVALYSLGSPALLAEATGEVVALLERWQLIGADHDMLDLGCGIGRFLVALAPKVRAARGLDISTGMVAEARRRTDHLANVQVELANGRDLSCIPDASTDLVLAADVMPYLVQAGAGLAATHVREFARVLRPGGVALVLNWSYRGDFGADRTDAAGASADAGLMLAVNGERPLSHWDAAAFLMQKT